MLNKLEFDDLTLYNSSLYGGIKYEININPNDDISFGTVACATVEFTTDALTSSSIGQTFTYSTKYQEADSWDKIGIFTILSATKDASGRFNVVAYDNVYKLEKIVDNLVNNYTSVTMPANIKEFLEDLMSYCGLTFISTQFTNYTMPYNTTLSVVNTTARELASYVAQCAGCYITANKDGDLTINHFPETQTQHVLGRDKYIKVLYADYTTNSINKLWVGLKDGDIGVTASEGSADNEYRITYNPLFYFSNTPSEVQPYVTALFNHIKLHSYVPANTNLYKDFGVNVGDAYYIEDRAGNQHKSYVFAKSWNSSGITLKSTGNKEREKTNNNEGSAIQSLNGRFNILQRDLEQTQSQVGILDGTMTTITQRADSIESVVQGNAHYYEQTDEPQNPVTGDIWKNGNVYKRYVSGNLPPWVTIDADEAENLLVINSIHHTLDGVVYEGPNGQTIINGSNITTGTISSDRIHMETGVISWGNLDSDVQGRIGASSYDDDDVASLLQRAYGIEYTTLGESYIESPEIYGGKIVGTEIYAGTNQDNGVLKLSSDGLNYANTSKTNIIGLGYVTIGSNQYPIISLGQGVDDSGTDQGLIKKYGNGIWIGDNDSINSLTPGGDGLFVNFSEGKIYKYENGYPSELGAATFG